jgi:NhaP-type Na+/H+ and K+/H+ antiporter
MVRLVKHFLIPDFLVGVAFLAVAMAVYAVSNVTQAESGLVTVTAMGVYLANQKHASMKAVTALKEHLVVLLISCLFIVLGSRLDLSQLPALGVKGLIFLVLLIFVIRPISVFLSTIRTELNWRERTFIAFLAPRGIVAAAVTSVFALEVMHLVHENSGLDGLASEAEQLVPMVFLVIIGTVAFYGLTAGPLAQFLKLAEKNPQGVLIAGAENWIRELAVAIQEEGFAVTLVDTNYRNVSAAKMQGLTAHAASILSEFVSDEMEIGGIGRMLALTPNDEVNSLATHEFAHLFGRESVFQLAPWDDRAGVRKSLPDSHKGRILFDSEATYNEIAQQVAIDHAVKRTHLTDEYTYADFKEQYGPTSLVLFVIDQEKKLLKVSTVETPLVPKKGERFIALVKQASAAAPQKGP